MILDKNNIDISYFINAPIYGPAGSKGKILRENRFVHLEESLKHVGSRGQLLEFGVRRGTKGSTFDMIARFFYPRRVHGFDSFEGLPEDWVMTDTEIAKKGSFANVEPPSTPYRKFWKGWFDETIDQYLKEYPKEKIAFLHIDSDLYSSAKTIFEKLNHLIVPGTVITFDELYPFGTKPYDTWAEHEWKALVEWITTYDRKLDVLSRNNHWQASIKVIE